LRTILIDVRRRRFGIKLDIRFDIIPGIEKLLNSMGSNEACAPSNEDTRGVVDNGWRH
jgi:hypothetical protein